MLSIYESEQTLGLVHNILLDEVTTYKYYTTQELYVVLHSLIVSIREVTLYAGMDKDNNNGIFTNASGDFYWIMKNCTCSVVLPQCSKSFVEVANL